MRARRRGAAWVRPPTPGRRAKASQPITRSCPKPEVRTRVSSSPIGSKAALEPDTNRNNVPHSHEAWPGLSHKLLVQGMYAMEESMLKHLALVAAMVALLSPAAAQS